MSENPEKVNLQDLTFRELTEFVGTLGATANQATELWRCLYRRFQTDFDDMTGLGASLQGRLSESARFTVLELLEEAVSADGLTTKVLFRLEDGKTIEAALMLFNNQGNGRERRTVCVSSQVGCPIGCRFCATGQQGFERNLSPGEIVAQLLYFIRRLENESVRAETTEPHYKATNVVFMGMGEPLANYENVRSAIDIIGSPKGLNMGLRQITLSTAGMVPEIQRLARENVPCQLALSLHAATDELRQQLVPLTRKYPLQELIAACREYSAQTRRHVYIEYALFNGINDSPEDADKLIELLGQGDFPINLIPCNITPGKNGFGPSPVEKAHAFQKRLIAGGIRAMLRVSRGSDIDAGCGQLKSRCQDNR
ncbi:23S rRNA (adenine(2503)-C(2))-methyltransferase RlmN [Dehalogenimonas etheniformans]|nr:23S rRNA (adenine(2503)-C(2))-methyltransferase RlmN [Dehalogenimonas etheniformans]QNT76795.1 23S rRNA (adenine(2503)-C(2))-methyltransferase RlmN [Dehalogenimonas etheniformans]